MKKSILSIAILVGFAAASNAQTSTTTATTAPAKTMQVQPMHKMAQSSMKMKDGVMMMNGKVMVCTDEKCAPLSKPYSFSDGSKIAADGTVTKADGTKTKLMNGYEMGKDGKMMMIPHGQMGHVCTKDCPMYGKM